MAYHETGREKREAVELQRRRSESTVQEPYLASLLCFFPFPLTLVSLALANARRWRVVAMSTRSVGCLACFYAPLGHTWTISRKKRTPAQSTVSRPVPSRARLRGGSLERVLYSIIPLYPPYKAARFDAPTASYVALVQQRTRVRYLFLHPDASRCPTATPSGRSVVVVACLVA